MDSSPQQQVHDDDPTTYRSGPPARRRSSVGRALLVFVLLLVVAVPLGYYAWQLWSRGKSTRAALQSANSELVELRKQHNERGGKISELEQQHAEHNVLFKQSNDKLTELNTALAAAQTRLDELDQERSKNREQLAEFEELMRQFQRMIDSGRLKVTFRRGRMIVELPARVLFPSGSAELTEEGSKSLGEVAKILRTMRDRRYIVAGHTDNVPVANGSNWDLSSERAVKVTVQLIAGGLRPEQLVAAGYSEYDPVARNTSEAGKQQNRRIEIILEPRLMPLPGLEQAVPKADPATP